MTLSAQDLSSLAAFVLDKTPEAVACLDLDGRFLYANESASRLLGQSAVDLKGKDIFSIAPEMVPVLWKELWKEIRGQGTFAFEFQLQGPQGRLLQVDIQAHRVELTGKEVACLIFHDTEERKRLRNLQQEFVTNVSHELRTPMTVIREGLSQVAEGLRGPINESQARALTLALSGIERMGRMIESMLDISKIEAGKIMLKKVRLDFNALAREAVNAFQALSEERRIELRLSIPPEPVYGYGDRDRLMQVLTNLIGNAFKYTEKGHILVEVAAKPQEVVCAVSDTGMGIAAENLEKIFVKFEQLGQSAFNGEKGTGLGLSISRGIVELHGGRIWAESAGHGKGSTIHVAIRQQTGRDVFREELTPLLQEVSRRGGSLSVVAFSLSGAAREEILTDMEPLVRRHSGRLSDILVRDTEALYLGLPSMVRREAERIVHHVLDAARQELGDRLHEGSVDLKCKTTSFPEDAADPQAFMNLLFQDPRAS